MLILSRREGDAVMIGDDVTVVVLRIEGSQVRVGISAPNKINIYREEILARLEPNDDRAAQPEAVRAPHLRPPVRRQAYKPQQPESASLPKDEIGNSRVRAIAKALEGS